MTATLITQLADALQQFVALADCRREYLGGLSNEMQARLDAGRAALAVYDALPAAEGDSVAAVIAYLRGWAESNAQMGCTLGAQEFNAIADRLAALDAKPATVKESLTVQAAAGGAVSVNLREALLQAESLIDTLTLACIDRVDPDNDPRRHAVTFALNATAADAPKAPFGYFSYGDDIGGFEEHVTAADARAAAEESLSYFRDDAADGWNDGVRNICWGVILGGVEETESRPSTPDDPCHPDCHEFVDYALTDYATPPVAAQAEPVACVRAHEWECFYELDEAKCIAARYAKHGDQMLYTAPPAPAPIVVTPDMEYAAYIAQPDRLRTAQGMGLSVGECRAILAAGIAASPKPALRAALEQPK